MPIFTRRGRVHRGLLGALLLLAFAATQVARAQPPTGTPPPGTSAENGRAAAQPGASRAGAPGIGRPTLSPVNVPLSAIDAELKLSDPQKESIKQIQDRFHRDQRALLPGFRGGSVRVPGIGVPGSGAPGNGAEPGSPDSTQQMLATMQKWRALEEKASAQISEILTDAQRAALPVAVTELDALATAGIPLDILGDLKLSQDQKARIVSISETSRQELRQKITAARESADLQQIPDIAQSVRNYARKQVMAVLSPSQKNMVQNFVSEYRPRLPGPAGSDGLRATVPPGGGPPPPGGTDDTALPPSV